MSDAAWAALAQMVTALCAALAAIFAQKAASQSKVTELKVDAHEEASAERSRLLKTGLSATKGFSPGRMGDN